MSSPRLERLKELVAKNPNGAFALYGLAMEYRSLGLRDKAVEAFEDLFAKHPEYVPAFLQRGGVLLELGRSEEAAATFRRGIEVCQVRGETHAREELEQALAQIP